MIVAAATALPSDTVADWRPEDATFWEATGKRRACFHVLRLDRRIDGRELPLKLVRERIAGYLHDANWRRAVHQYIQPLAGRGEVTGFALPTTGSPLVR